ncbi:MAG: hypothetical protein WKF41_01895 [Gaiellaceae bacterium]
MEAEFGDGLGELVQVGQKRLRELHGERDRIEREIGAVTRKLRVWESARDSIRGGEGPGLRLVATDARTKRELVLAFLNEHPDTEFKLVEIRRALQDRGWLANDKKAIHALEVAVLGMAERAEIHRNRARKGFYRLRSPAEPTEDDTTDESIGVQT